MKLALTFRDLTTQQEPFVLKWKIKDTILAQNWTKLLVSNILESAHPIEKTYCLQGWQTDWESSYSRNLHTLCRKVNQSIRVVNQKMGPIGYPHIDLQLSVEKLQSNLYQEYMNELHHHFELLMGPAWKVSEWYKKTTDDFTRTAIRMLNNYCHEIEHNVYTIREQKQHAHNPNWAVPCYVYVSCNGINSTGSYYHNKVNRYLEPAEFDCFQNQTTWGDVTIYYAQIGKSHMEVFAQNDQHIDRSNISSYQCLTGEAVIHFIEHGNYLTPAFRAWCKQHDFDLEDKTLGIGFPVVASLENPFATRKQLLAHLHNYDDIHIITVENDDGSTMVSRTYDYTWQDEETWKLKLQQ